MAHSIIRPASLLSLLVLGGCFPKENEALNVASEGFRAIDEPTDVLEEDSKPIEVAEVVETAASPDEDSIDDSPSPSPESEPMAAQVLAKPGGIHSPSGASNGSLGSRGSGLGGGGLGTKGIGSGTSGYGSGGGHFGARSKAYEGRMGLKKRKAIGLRRQMHPRSPRPPILDVQNSTEEYTDHGVNPFTMVSKDAKSTFSIDVDTASYTMARSKLKQGVLPAWEGVRAEEFINFFDYDYVEPSRGPFAVHMESMPDPFRSGHHIMRVGVQAKRFKASERPPLHLTFLVDVSGSMSSADKLGLAKTSMHTLVDNLQEGDTVAMATYAGRVARILEPTEATQAQRIHKAIDSLNSGGSTAMSSGIDLAYEMADESFEKGAENRVIILSDGDANVGASSWGDMLGQIKGYADQGVTLSTIGYGQGNYRDTLMEQLANKGDGNNFYVDTAKESDRIFGEKIGGTMITVARDTKIQVEFNPEAVEAYRLIGYENRDIADRDFRNDRVDAGEVGSGHSVTALYQVVLAEDHDGELATVRVRWEKPGADSKATERAFGFDADSLVGDPADSSDGLKLAYAAATFAEVLRQSPHAAEVDLQALRAMVNEVGTSTEARELARLIGTADRLGAMSAQASWVSKD